MMRAIIAIALLAAMSIISGCDGSEEQAEQNATNVTIVETIPGTDVVLTPIMSPGVCANGGGLWDECTNPCTGINPPEGEMCTEACVGQCRCGGIPGYNCPEGYRCRLTSRNPRDMGICVID